MDGAHTILLVEDDDATRTFLADNLTADGFDMLVADCVRDGRRLLEAQVPRPGRRRRGAARRRRARPRARGAVGRRHREPPRSAHARARPVGPRRRSSTGCAGSSAAPTTTSSSPSRTRSCGRGSRRCCGGPTSAAAQGALRVGELEIDPPSREVRLRGRADRALAEGVRAAAHAGRRAHAGVHEGGAAAQRLGLPLDRLDADAGLARVPAAAEARRDGDRFVRQRVGRRLPADRRAGGRR